MKYWLTLILIIGSVLNTAAAHTPSESYLNLTATQTGFTARWDIALRDLDYAIGLDQNDDRNISWGELRAQHATILQYALNALTLKTGNHTCQPQLSQPQQLTIRNQQPYNVLWFTVACPTLGDTLTLNYQLFAKLDANHRSLLTLHTTAGETLSVLNPNAGATTFSLTTTNTWNTFLTFIRQGIWHIWIGIDHILFLLALLLPLIALTQTGNRRHVFILITAFTAAHSITLALAILEWVTLPGRWVESAIAASVIIAALLNLRQPSLHRWPLAFGFGLLHGFGFAGALAELDLSSNHLIASLVGFNLGVEIGQLVIVTVFLPLAWWLQRTRYHIALWRGASAIIALIGLGWLVDRIFALELMPF